MSEDIDNKNLIKIKSESETSVEELINKTFKLIELDSPIPNKIGTRSTPIIVHSQLTFDTKPRDKKFIMADEKVILRLEDAIKIIPNCSGNDDTYQFINACDLAINSVDSTKAPYLIKYIITRLSGRALATVRDKDVGKWVNIKKYLNDAFEAQHTAAALQ